MKIGQYLRKRKVEKLIMEYQQFQFPEPPMSEQQNDKNFNIQEFYKLIDDFSLKIKTESNQIKLLSN